MTDNMKLRDYIPITILAIVITLGAIVVLSNQCSGGPTIPHDCTTINDGRGNETCEAQCGEGFVVTETYCVHCEDCMMCYYGCDYLG